MSHPRTLGELIASDVDARRDAIHVAISPFTAGRRLLAGAWFKLDASGNAIPTDADDSLSIGVVDPFLLEGVVLKGECFWGCIKPGAVTNLRHDWDHAAFPTPKLAAEVVERVVHAPEDPELVKVRDYAELHQVSVDAILQAAGETLNDGCRGCH